MISSPFLFALCQRGAERALKREVSFSDKSLRPAYQRPGVVTFRSDQERGIDARVDAVLARASGLSLGTEPDVDAVCARITALRKPLRLHVIETELWRPDEAPPQHVEGQLASTTEAALRAALPKAFLPGSAAQIDDVVLDVIVAPGDPILLGVHKHVRGMSPNPGGRFVYESPSDAPSRAFRKIEEAIAAFQLPMQRGDVALELGAAPGGAAYSLVRRGLQVIAVDPAVMDAHVLAIAGPNGARVTHIKRPMSEVDESMLPPQVQWLLMDVHLAPQVALRAVSRFTSLYKKSLLGVVFTLKLNQWSFLDELNTFLDATSVMGVVTPRAKQLPAHRQEIALAGLTKLGEERMRA